MLGFVYLRSKDDLTSRSDHPIALQMSVFSALSFERRLDAIDEYCNRTLAACD
jgi:hypothetical protein